MSIFASAKARDIQRTLADQWLGKAGVVWLDIGEKITDGRPTGQLSVKVGVIEKKPLSALRADEVVPQAVDGVPTDVIEVGRIVARSGDRVRPAIGGVSVGHVDVTAGTLSVPGLWAGAKAILSNSHVIAMQNDALLGDPIIQPGPFDFGADPADRIATFVRAAWIKFEGQALPNPMPAGYISQSYPNEVDAALGSVLSDELVDEVVGPWGAVQGTKAAAVGDLVKKIGRTTDETHGQVVGVASDLIVDYGGPMGRFTKQVTVSPGGFSAGGDSGSLIVTEAAPLRAVALLFAGSPTITIANPIERVLTLLGFAFGMGEPAQPTFPDVPADRWSYEVIEEMAALGVVGGFPDGLFHPEEGATREQICSMLSRFRAALGL